MSARFHSKSGHIDFKAIFPGEEARAAAWCFTEIDASSEGTLPVFLTFGRGGACFCNGDLVISVDSSNNELSNFVRLPLKKGPNLIGFRITIGHWGWRLNISKGAFIPKEAEPIEPVTKFASIYRGPVLLAYDGRFNDGDYSTEHIPHLVQPTLNLLPEWEKVPSHNPLVLVEGKGVDGKAVRYCDFASAGATGNYYQSWVPVRFPCPEVEFSRENLRRSEIIR